MALPILPNCSKTKCTSGRWLTESISGEERMHSAPNCTWTPMMRVRLAGKDRLQLAVAGRLSGWAAVHGRIQTTRGYFGGHESHNPHGGRCELCARHQITCISVRFIAAELPFHRAWNQPPPSQQRTLPAQQRARSTGRGVSAHVCVVDSNHQHAGHRPAAGPRDLSCVLCVHVEQEERGVVECVGLRANEREALRVKG